jgi:hypothetical protein
MGATGLKNNIQNNLKDQSKFKTIKLDKDKKK